MAKRKPRYRPPASFAAQPKIALIIRRLNRQRGATATEMAKVVGWRNPESVTAVIARLGQVGFELWRRKDRTRGGTVYGLISKPPVRS